MRDRRDRDRKPCPNCGKDVTVRRDGGLMAHRAPDGGPCVEAAWRQRQAEATEGPVPAAAHETGLSRQDGALRAVCQTCPWRGPDRGPWPASTARTLTAVHLDAAGHKQDPGGRP